MTNPNDLRTPEEREEQAELLTAVRQTCRRAKSERTLYDVCKEITTNSSAMRHQGRLIDHFSASAYVLIYEKLSPDNQNKLADVAAKNPLKAFSICFKLCR